MEVVILYRPELDGRFYEIAMSFFVEAGHVSASEPEYCNLSLNHISGVAKASIESIDVCFFLWNCYLVKNKEVVLLVIYMS